MELTWITFPTIVITVSLLAYFAAYRLKGNDLLVNKVDVIDVDQAAGLVRGRTILSLFSALRTATTTWGSFPFPQHSITTSRRWPVPAALRIRLVRRPTPRF